MLVQASFRYRVPLEQALPRLDEHRAHLRSLHAAGELVMSGPFEPRTGGGLLLCVADMARARAITDADPFVLHGLTSYTLEEWRPVIGTELVEAWEARRVAR